MRNSQGIRSMSKSFLEFLLQNCSRPLSPRNAFVLTWGRLGGCSGAISSIAAIISFFDATGSRGSKRARPINSSEMQPQLLTCGTGDSWIVIFKELFHQSEIIQRSFNRQRCWQPGSKMDENCKYSQFANSLFVRHLSVWTARGTATSWWHKWPLTSSELYA